MEEWKRLAKLTKEKKYKHEEDKESKDFKEKYGFDYRETWDLDFEIACFVLPRLAYLRENHSSYPGNLTVFAEDGVTVVKEGNEEWNEILEKIIRAFEIIVDGEIGFETEEELKVIDEGLDLFRKYFRSLWD